MTVDHLIERDVEKIYIPNTIYGIGGGGKEAVLQLFERDWFAVEAMRSQNGTTNVYLVDTTENEDGINERISERQAELDQIRDRMRETLTGERIGGINLQPVEVTQDISTDRAASLTGKESVPDIKKSTNIDHWWLDRNDLIEPGTSDLYDFSNGACRCRAIGKAFHYKALAQGQRNDYELNYNIPGDDDKVAIFAGLAGGTGSGLIIDIAKRLYQQREARRITLFATIPGRNEMVKERANAFAALSELEYQAFVEEDDIFDNIVLFPLQPLDPDVEVKADDLIELDQAMAYAVLGYYNSGQFDDAVGQSPAYAPFTIALPQIFRYDIEGILEAKENAIETTNRKVRALNAEREIYDAVISYVDTHYTETSSDGIKRTDEDKLKSRVTRLRELVELPLFEELEFVDARTAGREFLNEIHDANTEDGEQYTDKQIGTAFAENDLDDLLGRRLEFYFDFEYDDIDVTSELNELDELTDDRVHQLILAEVARLRDKYEASKSLRHIPTTSSGDEANQNLVEYLIDSDPNRSESALVNAVQGHRDEIEQTLTQQQTELSSVESEIQAELDVQENLVQSEVDNWENAISEDLKTVAELRALDIGDDIAALNTALENYATALQQNQTPPSGEDVKTRLDRLRDELEDVEAINFQNEYEQIWQQVEQARQLRRTWDQYEEAQNQGFFQKYVSNTPDSKSAKKELRTAVTNITGKVFDTQNIGPNTSTLSISATYDPQADGELLDQLRREEEQCVSDILDEFEKRLDRIAQEEGDGSYPASAVEQLGKRVDTIDSPDGLNRERQDLVEFVNKIYRKTASEDLPELESRQTELEAEIDELRATKGKYEDLLEVYRTTKDHHETFTSQYAAFKDDLNKESERFGTKAFAEYQPTDHYIHKYTPKNTLRAIEEQSLAETELFLEDWEHNERDRIKDFTEEVVKNRAIARDYTGLREIDFGNSDYTFDGTRIHVAKISEALDTAATDKTKLHLDDLAVKEQLSRNYNLDDAGQGRRLFEQWAIQNGGPWDVGMTFFIQGLGFLDNLRDVVEQRGYKDSYDTRKAEIHNIALHHGYGLDQGFYVYRKRFIDPSDPEDQRLYLEQDALSIQRELCGCLERVPLTDDLGIERGAPSPVAYHHDSQQRANGGPPTEQPINDHQEDAQSTAQEASDGDAETANLESSELDEHPSPNGSTTGSPSPLTPNDSSDENEAANEEATDDDSTEVDASATNRSSPESED